MKKVVSVARLEQVVAKMIARCDEIADSAKGCGRKACNFFSPNESRKTAKLCLDFLSELAAVKTARSLAPARDSFAALAASAARANDALTACLPKNCRCLITCIASGEQFILNLLLRGDSTALALAKIAHHMALPLRQIFLLCSQKLHEQLTVGC